MDTSRLAYYTMIINVIVKVIDSNKHDNCSNSVNVQMIGCVNSRHNFVAKGIAKYSQIEATSSLLPSHIFINSKNGNSKMNYVYLLTYLNMLLLLCI